MTRLSQLTSRNLLIAAHDLLASIVALFAAFYIRFEGASTFWDRVPLLLQILPYFIAFSFVVFYFSNLLTTKWRFTSLPDALNIVRVATVLALAFLVLDYIIVAPNVRGTFFFGKLTIILFWFLEIFALSTLRFAYRYFRYTRVRRHARSDDAAPALLIGRAADAEVVLRGIESGAVKRIWPIGILSPSMADRGQLIRGVPVLGGIDDVEDVAADFARRDRPIARALMMPTAFDPDCHPETFLMRARRLRLIVSRLPSLESGDAPRLTPVAVEDLLLRPSHKIDYGRLEALVRGKAVVVTGGGGSIGAEICQRVVAFGAARLLILENSEPALYAITEALAADPEANVVVEGRIADIRDRDRVFALIGEFKPALVFHAAALKHVPILERDWSEGVKTNIFGSINVADAAVASGAEAMVMISTDKAIEPVSILGLTKRFAEMYCQALDRQLADRPAGRPPMRLISVRFGNVLASNGSVVPKFKAQIEAGGPVTVTHPDMVRYFMTIREACDLVITAASHALAPQRPDVSVYVLNMGQPVRIVELAERMIRLSGLQPGYDIEIKFTGIRPGERLNEILFASEEPPAEIGVAGIMAATPNEPPMPTLKAWIAALDQAIGRNDPVTIKSVLKDAVPEFGSSAA
ncbi:putative polysaccharide biosynthesis protein (capD-like) [Bradyrhizobium sp. ORS 375]|uniref:polysaccharide biosynthesis protein n=1 Tax=Bradyrhizobium sp. (strain ORS 375) TaxID=566679 RepID=UPI0002406950|nr:nucleoside-diphosphate sugar epimerase/dehydratase [Bradyrhizobium sp. ORS 375]CCD93648.1 putative polysaccharide biosynthesis protein (capD-like) [Bradyrhizobium sp. ORS 375]